MTINYYLGRFGNEKLLFAEEQSICPVKGDFVYYNSTMYKVMYRMYYKGAVIEVFLREIIEEDF